MQETLRLLMEKERHFREFQIWPLASRLDIRTWLENFDTADVDIALLLANAFVHVSEPLTDAMFSAAIQTLLNGLAAADPTKYSSLHTDSIGFVLVEGEKPSATDSSHLFARKLRDKLSVPQAHILRPLHALGAAAHFSTYIFVDDFVGSGQQMLHTWYRQYAFPDGTVRSFASLAQSGKHTLAYCPAICSALGKRELAKIGGLILSPAHVLTDRDQITNTASPVWRSLPVQEGIDFIRKYGERAGYAADDSSEEDWSGFNKQGLALSFHHGTPDATLPIFRSTRGGWQPLVRN